MTDRRKLEKAFELFINEEDEASNAMMHEYYVSLARRINEELQDAELEEADLHYDDDIDDDMAEIDAEEGVREDEDEYDVSLDGDDEMGGDDMEMGGDYDGGDDMDMGGDMDMEMGDDEYADDMEMPEIADLVAELETLVTKFDELASAEGGMDDEMGGDYDGGDDMEGDMMGDMGGDYSDEEGMEYEDDEEMDYADSDDESLEEAAALSKVASPANSEGKDAGAGGSFATNTKSIAKAQGSRAGHEGKPNISTGGETKGHKPISNPKGVIPKDMGTVSSGKSVSKKKAKQPKPVEGGEVGQGKNRSVDKSSIISKKVR